MRGLRHLQGGGGCDMEQMRAIWKTLKEALNTGENGGVLVGGLLCCEREKTKDFSCIASHHTDECFHGDQKCWRGPREVRTLLLGALRSQHHPFP